MDLALNNLERLICHKTQPTIIERIRKKMDDIILIIETNMNG